MGDGRWGKRITPRLYLLKMAACGARVPGKTSLSAGGGGDAYILTIHPHFQKLPHGDQRWFEDARQARTVWAYSSR